VRQYTSRNFASVDVDVFARRPCEQQLDTTRPHSGQQHVRPRRDEHEHGTGRRFLQRLEQCALCGGSHRLGAVHHEHAAAAFERTIAGPLDDGPDLIDFDRNAVRSFDDRHVRMNCTRDTNALRARAARIEREESAGRRLGRLTNRVEAVQRLRNGNRGRTLACGLGAREDQARRKRVPGNRSSEQLDDAAVTVRGKNVSK
jgi:hypothetical protein